MAITKIHPIKSTLNLAIKYICNPDKTDGNLLISSFGCEPETASIEFDFTRNQGLDGGKILAQRLVQAFLPNETTPEQAHQIGIQLAERLLKGKYEYVITTHIDKGHLHNHIVFNNIDMDKHRSFEYQQNQGKNVWKKIRKLSDELCSENGLSVIQNADKSKGVNYFEWSQDQKENSWKTKLKNAIDNTVKQSDDFDNFLLRMKMQGYEIKQGKHIAFRAKDQERFTRAKRLGWYYEEAQIKSRINRNIKHKKSPAKYVTGMKSLIDIEQQKFKESEGLSRWARIKNLQEASKAVNFLSEHVENIHELENSLMNAYDENLDISDKLKAVEKELSNLLVTSKHISIYRDNKPVNDEYKKANDQDKYFRRHESELLLFDASKNALKNLLKPYGNKIPNDEKISSQIDKLREQETELKSEYQQSKKEIKNIETALNNLKELMKNKDIEKERSNERS